MRARRLATFLAFLTGVAALVAGCGSDVHRVLSFAGGGPAPASVGRLSTQNAVNLCGRVLSQCDERPVALPNVKVTAAWSGHPVLTTFTDANGDYCFQVDNATGFDVTVCVDPGSLPTGATLLSTNYPGDGSGCQTVYLQYPDDISDADFNYAGCGGPPAAPCTIPGWIASGFNGTAVTGTSSGPAYIWFNSNFNLKNAVAGGHVTLTNASVVINGVPHAVPDATITFAQVGCATTSYDAIANRWDTVVPVAGSDEIFLSGLAFPVTNLPGGAKVTWQGTFATDIPGVCLAWKWGAAAYRWWPTSGADIDYNAANIKPTHTGACITGNADHAGTPETPIIRKSVTGGARGGGGSNYTGSWSGTQSLCPPCATKE